MNNKQFADVLRSGLFAAWGLATLVLFFTVVLLAYEYYRAGNASGAVFTATDAPSAPRFTASETVEETEITLYFGASDSLRLDAERRLLVMTGSTTQNCKRAFNELTLGPRSGGVRLLDAGASVRAAYHLDDGTLVFDLARNANVPQVGSATAEALMLRSIVATFSQEAIRGREGPPVRSVRFLYEGSLPTDQFPAHIDLSSPISVDRSWLTSPSGSIANE